MLIVLAAFGVLCLMFGTSKPSLKPSTTALAELKMPLGGATITHLSAYGGKEANSIPVVRRGDEIWPTKQIPAHSPVTVVVTLKRPGSVAWLTGKTKRLVLHMTAPSASLEKHYLTLQKGQPITLDFKAPVKTFAYGTAGHMKSETFATPRNQVTITPPADAGTMDVRATLRSWESAKIAPISWFPAGGAATAVASPVPGKSISPNTKITMTFSTTVQKALGGHMPQVTPAGSGSWHTISSHAIQFVPSGDGYGLGAHVSMALPSGVRVVGGQAAWTVPGGTTQRLQQLLSELGYLPFNVNSQTSVPKNAIAQENAATHTPKATLDWKYGNVPAPLKNMWEYGTFGTMTKGALMAFENDNDMTADGVAGPAVWKQLITNVDNHKVSTFGYTFVTVHEADSGESESTWHSGKTVVSGAVNTGTAAAGGTATGVYPVFEHAPSVTMSGVNPDGSHYVDPGILWVSYFNGGDALHEYPRGSYGYPQSDGCVEMPDSEAAAVYPYTPIGTLVDVTTD